MCQTNYVEAKACHCISKQKWPKIYFLKIDDNREGPIWKKKGFSCCLLGEKWSTYFIFNKGVTIMQKFLIC